MTLDLSSREHDALVRYCDERGVTKSRGLLMALNLLFRAKEAIDDGFTVGAFSPECVPGTFTPVRQRIFHLHWST